MEKPQHAPSSEWRALWTVGKALLLCISGILAIHPLLTSMLPHSADGLLHVYRLVELDHCLRNGVLFPRWSPDLGYGYGFPLFNFYAPLSYYLAEVWHLLGLGFIQAINASVACSILLAGIGAYLFVTDVFGEPAGLVAAVAYMYAPYQLYDALFRGAMPETLALALFPWILWAFRRLALNAQKRYLIVSTLLLAALFLTHNISSLVVTAILVVYIVCVWLCGDRQIKQLFYPLSAVVLGLGSSAFFWLPAFLEKGWVQIYQVFLPGGFDYHNNFLSLSEFLSPPVPVDPSWMNPLIPRAIGLIQLTLAIFAVAGLWRFHSREAKQHVGLFLLLLGGLSWMMSSASVIIWEHLPLLKFVQFPWRFLGPASLTTATLAGATTRLVLGRGKSSRLTSCALPIVLLLLMASSLTWQYPSYYPPMKEPSVADVIPFEQRSGALGTTSAGDYLPVWVKKLPDPSSLEAAYQAGGPVERLDEASLPQSVAVKEAHYGLTSSDVVVESPQPFQATFRWFYFPGWRAYVNGKATAIHPTDPGGLVSMEIPAGRNRVQLRFEDTPLRVAGESLSVLSIVALLMLAILGSKRPLPTKATHAASGLRFSAWQWGITAAIALALFATKLGYLDRYDTWFRRSRLHGTRVDGMQVPLVVNFDDELLLLGYDLRPASTPSGEAVYLDLYWKAQQELTSDYSVSAQLVDSQGNLYGQKDNQHPGEYPTSRWNTEQYVKDRHVIRTLPGTPPGEYVINVGVYSVATLQGLNVLNEHKIPVGTWTVTGKVNVAPAQKAPATAELGIEHPVTAQFGPALYLLGYNLPRAQVLAGDEAHFTLFWQAVESMRDTYTARVELIDKAGQVVARHFFPLGGTAYPTLRWKPWEVLRTQHTLSIPAEATTDRYYLQLTVVDAQESPLADPVALGDLQVEAPAHVMTVPSIPNPMQANWNNEIGLLGYDLSQKKASPGDTLRLTLYWQAKRTMRKSYSVFTHLLDSQNHIWAQKDGVPANWTRPTTGWVAGEVIADEYKLSIDPQAPAGSYVLEIGLYEAASGQRLPVVDGQGQIVGDHLLLPQQIQVAEPAP